MGSIMVALRGATAALSNFERGMGVVQTNVANASTPGYSKQRLVMQASAGNGVSGESQSVRIEDSRSVHLDNAVQKRLESWGEADERVQHLERMEPVYDVTGETGVAASINRLMQAASAAAVAPNDDAARRVLLSRAEGVAQSLNVAAAGLTEVQSRSELSLRSTVRNVNSLAGEIAEVNAQMKTDFKAQQDPRIQARLHTALDDLAELVDITVTFDGSGAANVYAGGESLLVIGDRQYPLSADYSGHQSRVLGHDGADLSAKIDGGRLAALLDLNNSVLPAHAEDLNRLAQAVADGANRTLRGGVDRSGQPPQQDLFSYDAVLGAARTIQTNGLTPDELALADPAAPNGNGVALKLEALFGQKTVDGLTFSQFYGNMASNVGRQVEGAHQGLNLQEALRSQAEAMRDQVQKVDLNEEAVVLMEFQRAYQASAQLIRTLNEIIQSTLDILR